MEKVITTLIHLVEQNVSFLRKILYYRDYRLFLRIIKFSWKLQFRKFSLPTIPANTWPEGKIIIGKNSLEKIYQYVGLFLCLRRACGLRNTCLSRAILLCGVLREAGFPAQLNLGTDKTDYPSPDGWPLIGHSWVTIQGTDLPADYPFVVRYP